MGAWPAQVPRSTMLVVERGRSNKPEHTRLQKEREARDAVRDFVEGATSGDTARMFGSLEPLSYGHHWGGGWRKALVQIRRLPELPATTREWFLQRFLDDGERLRQDIDDDLLYLDALRLLLPPYSGPPVQVYRGETMDNHQQRTYGYSWSATREIALGFAERGYCRLATGGSVLLSARASSDAILCAPALLDDRQGEQEYIVDRRHLKAISVDARFYQLEIAEFDALSRSLAEP